MVAPHLAPVLLLALLLTGQGRAETARNLGLPDPRQTIAGAQARLALPDADQLANPPGLAAWQQTAREIATGSAAEALARIEALAEASTGAQGVPARAAPDTPPGRRLLPEPLRATVLVSLSLGEAALADLFRKAEGRRDIRLAFRGVPPGARLIDFALALRQIARKAGTGEGVEIVIDPALFRQSGLASVPAVLIEDLSLPEPGPETGPEPGPETGPEPGRAPQTDRSRILLTASGFSDPDPLLPQLQAGTRLLRQPVAFDILEEDILLRARREAAAVLNGLTRDGATIRNRFWERTSAGLDAMGLTPAPADRRRPLSLVWVAPDTIRDAEGQILALPGQVFEPAEHHPFDRRLLVFDPTRAAELDFVETALRQPRPGVQRTLLIAARLGGAAATPQDGMAGQGPTQSGPPDPARTLPAPAARLQALVDRFGLPVFVLTEELRQRFALEHTPTEIYPQITETGRLLLAEEHALPSGPAPPEP